MPQISKIKLKDIKEAKRFDAEYFKQCYIEIEKKINQKGYIIFEEFADITDGIHESIDFDDKSNILLFSAKAPKENYFDISKLGYISKTQHEKNPRTSLKVGDIILSTVGTIGNCAVVTEDVLPANADRHVGIIRSKNISPYFISTFLLSKYGRMQTKRYTVGNVQPNLYIKDMKKFKLPLVTYDFQMKIETIVKEAYKKLEESKKLYKEAEYLLLKELDLINFKPKNSLTFTIRKREIEQSKRFDAEYFQPKYEDILEKIANYRGGWEYIKNCINIKDKNFKPKDNQKYKYIELSSIDNSGNIEDIIEDFGSNLPTRARRKVNKNDVIISSIEGSLNSIALITDDFDNSLCSTGFYVINSKKLNSKTLLVLFKSIILQMQLKKGCKGTILTAIPKDELEKIKIPLILPEVQIQIAKKIEESHRLRKESKELLEEAKLKVEEEIEK